MASSSRDIWFEVLQQATAFLEVLRDGEMRYVDGRFEFAAPAIPKARPATAGTGGSRRSEPAAAQPAPELTPEMREALKAALVDPYAHLTAQAAPPRPQPSAPLPSAVPRQPIAPPRAIAPATPTGPAPILSSGEGDFFMPSDPKRDEHLEKLSKARSLEAVHAIVRECCMCGLGETRTNGVPGEGNPHAELMFIGEAPGYNEDVQGRPFVGQAGKLLDKMIEAMGFRREDVFIGNIVKCRPPNNREPSPEEMKLCEPFLLKQLKLIKPKVIVTLGRIAIQGLLKESTPITKLRGNWREFNGIPVMPTFHPAYLLRNPSQKRPCWEDLQKAMARLKEVKELKR